MLSFIEPIFACNVPLVCLIFLKRSLVFPIVLFSSTYLHWPLRKVFLSLLTIVWNSAFKWYIFPFLLCFSLLFFSQLFVRPPQTAILPFFAFLLLGGDFDHRLLYSVTSVRPSFLAGTVSIRSDPLNAGGCALPVVSRQCWCFVHTLLQHRSGKKWDRQPQPGAEGPELRPETLRRSPVIGVRAQDRWDACQADWHRAVWSGGCPCVLAPPAWSWGKSVLRGWVETKWAWQQWLEARGAWWQGELAELQAPTRSGPGLPSLTVSCCLSALNFVCMWLSQEVGPGAHWPQATDLGLQGDLDVGWGKRKINAAAGA